MTNRARSSTPVDAAGAAPLGATAELTAPDQDRRDLDPARRGCFITFEGIEGSGKSTQVLRLAARLRGAGRDAVATREPGGTDLGRELRALLLDAAGSAITPLGELLLYAADRAQHLVDVVEPAIERGAVVLCDRYLDATLAYQGYGRELPLEWILDLHRIPPLDRRPHRTVLLDLDPIVGLTRARIRNDGEARSAAEGRFEKEDLEFHRRVRDGYLALAAAEPARFRILSAVGDPDAIEDQVQDLLRDLLPETP